MWCQKVTKTKHSSFRVDTVFGNVLERNLQQTKTQRSVGTLSTSSIGRLAAEQARG